MVKFKELFS